MDHGQVNSRCSQLNTLQRCNSCIPYVIALLYLHDLAAIDTLNHACFTTVLYRF